MSFFRLIKSKLAFKIFARLLQGTRTVKLLYSNSKTFEIKELVCTKVNEGDKVS